MEEFERIPISGEEERTREEPFSVLPVEADTPRPESAPEPELPPSAGVPDPVPPDAPPDADTVSTEQTEEASPDTDTPDTQSPVTEAPDESSAAPDAPDMPDGTPPKADTVDVLPVLTAPSAPAHDGRTFTEFSPRRTTPKTDSPRTRKRPEKRRRRRWLWSFLAGMAAAGLLAAGFRVWERNRYRSVGDRFLWDFREDYEEERGEDLTIRIPTWPVGDGPAFEIFREHGETKTAQEVYRTVNPSVVTVMVGLDDNTAAVGTGVIFSPDGYFVTNYHVVEGGTECRAMLDSGRSYPALYVAGDAENDLAVLKMDGSEHLTAAQFGDSELLTVGDDVYAIGNPLGIEFRGTLTNGIVSAIDRDVLVEGRTMTLIQTNAALNSGNSGGPLINEYGQVVGINVVKMSSRRSTVEGLGFAIPSAFMERLVNDLLTYGEVRPEPVIGISVDPYGTEVEPELWGIGVQKVERGSPAERAGVQEGDYVIFADGETVSSSRDLLRVRRHHYLGETMFLTLWRNGERVDVTLEFTQ